MLYMKKVIYDENEINDLASILDNNEVICVPTDTVFGLCSKTNSLEAYNNLVDIKDRPINKLFPVMCSDIEQIRDLALINDNVEKIIKEFMPGPLTIILKIKDNPHNYIDLKQDTIAIRLATSDVLYKLIKLIDCPLFMTSANKSGASPCKNIDEVICQIPNIGGILKGSIFYSIPSTIIDCSNDDIKIIRNGPITLEDIKKVL